MSFPPPEIFTYIFEIARMAGPARGRWVWTPDGPTSPTTPPPQQQQQEEQPNPSTQQPRNPSPARSRPATPPASPVLSEPKTPGGEMKKIRPASTSTAPVPTAPPSATVCMSDAVPEGPQPDPIDIANAAAGTENGERNGEEEAREETTEKGGEEGELDLDEETGEFVSRRDNKGAGTVTNTEETNVPEKNDESKNQNLGKTGEKKKGANRTRRDPKSTNKRPAKKPDNYDDAKNAPPKRVRSSYATRSSMRAETRMSAATTTMANTATASASTSAANRATTTTASTVTASASTSTASTATASASTSTASRATTIAKLKEEMVEKLRQARVIHERVIEMQALRSALTQEEAAAATNTSPASTAQPQTSRVPPASSPQREQNWKYPNSKYYHLEEDQPTSAERDFFFQCSAQHLHRIKRQVIRAEKPDMGGHVPWHRFRACFTIPKCRRVIHAARPGIPEVHDNVKYPVHYDRILRVADPSCPSMFYP